MSLDTSSVVASAACGRSQPCTPPVPKAAPWLVFPYGEGKKSQAFFNICELNNKTCTKSILELSGKSFWQKASHRGWLIILCNDESYKYTPDWKYGDCFLWNPASLENIRLPSLLQWIDKPEECVLVDCVLTSPPSRYEDAHDSTVVFLLDNLEHVLLLFCHPDETQWRIKRIPLVYKPGDVVSLRSFKNKLYVTFESANHLLEIEKEQLVDDNIETLRPLELSSTKFPLPEVDNWFSNYVSIVESDDEIFKVRIYYNRGSKEVMSIDVWRLELSLLKWEEMSNLGDHVIFIGMNTGVCCSAAAKLGLKSGCLYYTLPEDQSLYKFEVNDTGNAVIQPSQKLQTPFIQSEWIMMMPDDGRKRLEDTSGKYEGEEEKSFKIKAVENRTTSNYNETQDQEKHNKVWGTLNEDMLALVANYLHPFDYGRFRSVCKENRQILPIKKRASECPWLVFSRDNTYNFVNPAHHYETYHMNFSDMLLGATVRCQNDGWLLLSREEKLFLCKPFTREIIKLPDLPKGYNFSSIFFESSPSKTPLYAVLAIAGSSSGINIFLTVTGADSWDEHTNVEKFMASRSTPIFYNNVLYCTDYNGTLASYDMWNVEPWNVFMKPEKLFNDDMNPIFLVECGGDVLLVKLGHLGAPVRVFRLDLSEMEWVKIESLGKYTLFISNTSCLSAITPNSRMKNRIYFPRLCLNGEGVLFYSLETGSYHSSGQNKHSPNNFYETEGWISNCTWIQPNWSKSTAQQLDWFAPQPEHLTSFAQR